MEKKFASSVRLIGTAHCLLLLCVSSTEAQEVSNASLAERRAVLVREIAEQELQLAEYRRRRLELVTEAVGAYVDYAVALPRAELLVVSVPPGSRVYMVPSTLWDFRNDIADGLAPGGPFDRGVVPDSSGLKIDAQETSYELIVQHCGDTVRRTVYLTRLEMRRERAVLQCPIPR